MVYTENKSEYALYVEHGYGQVEPNHLSAQRTGQIYAQLPAKKDIKVLENGQFVKYNYADNVVDFDGEGEWMLVFNEIKLYHENEAASDFAMIRGNYLHNIYSPYGTAGKVYQSRYYGPEGKVMVGTTSTEGWKDGANEGYITAPAREGVIGSTDNPFANMIGAYKAQKMTDLNENVDARSMVPRVLKTNIGDIFTTNTIAASGLAVGDILIPNDINGYLRLYESGSDPDFKDLDMAWQVVKKYTMPDGQRGVKIMRIL